MVRRQDSATGRTNDIGQVKKNYIGTPIDHTDTQFYVPVGMCYVHHAQQLLSQRHFLTASLCHVQNVVESFQRRVM